ncbi:ice-binding family protein [Janthinobacterium sp. SUN118]|uniref:ice-binding family protein n=1 Tax=Janthinobacterium sp. SUN118 TaxID=3004100 RepID=UPI0025B271C7|nr:ice-binding family protein [Janthinobacterium sp. SUN118]MDN2712903.1 ice-binding family protein [Janthinobacterium sp. SUN118]
MNLFQRYLNPLLVSAGLLAMAALAGCGGGDQGRDPILGLPATTLASLTVTPATATLAIGGAQQFTAIATYGDGSSQDVSAKAAWTSATPASATVNASSGLAAGVAAGGSSISAAFGGKSATAQLTVSPATLTAIAITPLTPSIAIGASQQFTVTGSFSDSTTRDVTAVSAFASASPATAGIAADGLALGKVAGTTQITATTGTLMASTVLTVTPATLLAIAVAPQNPIVAVAATRQLAVLATYSDGSTVDVTAGSSFVAATPAVASVASGGLVTGLAFGSSVMNASFNGKTASTSVTVPALTLVSIAVTPATASIAVGGVQQFVATATYSDGSNAVVTAGATWTAGTVANATVLNTGVATGIAVGTSNITATAGGQSGSALLTVTAVAIPPVFNPINLGRAAPFGVLAGTSITNNSGGTTLITGDVGAPSQTVDPTQAAGFSNYKSGAILAGAMTDLQAAITDGNSRSCDVSFAGGIDLGGQTFGPGVYCYAGAISITGTLTLNGPGVYIFRTALTLNSTVNSVVALNNGATADNVSWLPVGPTTLAANSVFKGNILGQSAAITVGDNTTLLNGRVLTAAAVTLRNNQITK